MIITDGHDHIGHMKVGLWCLAGLLGFLLLEKGFAEKEEEESEEQEQKEAVKDDREVLVCIIKIRI